MNKKTLIGSALLVLLVDQVSKIFVVNNNFPYIVNSAGIFGWFGHFGLFSEIVLYSILIIVGLHSLKTTLNSSLETLALGLLLGGGLGNLLDRLNFNGVIDFLILSSPFTGGLIKFNVADIALTSAVIIMTLDYIKTQLYEKS